jgi:hypothetical protein
VNRRLPILTFHFIPTVHPQNPRREGTVHVRALYIITFSRYPIRTCKIWRTNKQSTKMDSALAAEQRTGLRRRATPETKTRATQSTKNELGPDRSKADGLSKKIDNGEIDSDQGNQRGRKHTTQSKIQKQIFLLNSNKIHTITEVTVLPPSFD